MKNLLTISTTTFATLMVLFSGFAQAETMGYPHPRPIPMPRPNPIVYDLTAQSEELALTLQEIAVEARQIAEQARFGRHPLRARRYFDLAYATENLSRDMSSQVVRPLRLGANVRGARFAFENLEYEFRKVNDIYSTLVLVPRTLQLRVYKARDLHTQIKARFAIIR